MGFNSARTATAAGLLGLAALSTLVGCATPPGLDRYPITLAPGATSSALPSEFIADYDRARLRLPQDGWECARRDATLGNTTRQPLLATRQWPEPLPPAERRYYFDDWFID